MSKLITCRLQDDLVGLLDRYAAEHANGSRSAAAERILRGHLVGATDPTPREGQDRGTGAAANAWGRTAANRIAKMLGGEKKVDESANIYLLPDGRRALIKNARGRGDRVNVLPGLLGRFEVLFAGFWDEQGAHCDLFEIPAEQFERHAHEATRGKFLQIDRRTIERLGFRPVAGS